MITVVIADDHIIVRQGLRALLDTHPNVRVKADVGNGRDAVASVKKHKPDVAVIDVTMPEMNGVEATRQILDTCTHTRVIGLSMHDDRCFAMRMLQAGARGYLLKEGAFEELVTAIHAVVEGRLYLGVKITNSVLDALIDDSEDGDPLALTARERQVLQLVAEGYNTREMAERLDVSQKTIETYRKRLMDKLDAHSIAELTKIAVREGVTSI